MKMHYKKYFVIGILILIALGCSVVEMRDPNANMPVDSGASDGTSKTNYNNQNVSIAEDSSASNDKVDYNSEPKVIIKEVIKNNYINKTGSSNTLSQAMPESAPRGLYGTNSSENHYSFDDFSDKDTMGGSIPNNSNEDYNLIVENSYKNPRQDPLSTFSIDVDTASYSNMRRYLNGNQLPPKDSVRIEELINYFSYDYPQPQDRVPFSRIMEVAECPWNANHWLVHVGVQGFSTPQDDLPPTNLVFLLDVSGSMAQANKLPLLKTAMGLLTEQLRPQDSVSIVVYAGAAGVVLPPTSGSNKDIIMRSLSNLQAGGSTNGGQGIELAYSIAQQNYIPNGINRVILATDGDFNVGVSNRGDLVRMIEQKKETGIFLTVLGLGMGNLKDSTMEQLADKGNGAYAYIDTLSEARKVLIYELGSTLFTIAKDVKIQVEFNPNFVSSYRLIGYENRIMQAQDFNDDTKDAGEIGSGHSVTALYEIVPAGEYSLANRVDPLRYQKEKDTSSAAYSDEILTLKIRYKEPQQDVSQLLTSTLTVPVYDINSTSMNFRFSAAVAAFGLLIRDSQYKNNASMELVRSLAMSARGDDYHGYRREFIDLVNIASALMRLK